MMLALNTCNIVWTNLIKEMIVYGDKRLNYVNRSKIYYKIFPSLPAMYKESNIVKKLIEKIKYIICKMIKDMKGGWKS